MYFCHSPSLGICSTPTPYQQHQNTTTPQHHNTTTPQHHNTTTQQHNNTTTQQHNNTTTQQHNNTTTQQHNNTRGKVPHDQGTRGPPAFPTQTRSWAAQREVVPLGDDTRVSPGFPRKLRWSSQGSCLSYRSVELVSIPFLSVLIPMADFHLQVVQFRLSD